MPLETSAFQPQTPDPVWDTYRSGFPAREEMARRDAEMKRKRAQTQYDQGVYDLGRRVEDTRSNTLTSLEGRGVLRSGETQKRLAEITSREEEARARAAAALIEQQSAAESELQRQVAAMYAEYEQQAAAAREREWQNALQIWYANEAAVRAGQAAPPQPTRRTAPYTPTRTSSPSVAGPPQPTLQQVAAAMRPQPVPYTGPPGFNTSGYPV